MSEAVKEYSEIKPLYDDVFRITNNEQAEKWLGHLLEKVKSARVDCNVMIPDNQGLSVQMQRKAERAFLIHYGSFMGTLRSLHAMQFVSDFGYEKFRRDCQATLAPTLVG